jgi:hypothetical protein
MSEWRRLSEVAEPAPALAALEHGADWIFFWCGGGSTRASDRGTKAQAALNYAHEQVIGPDELQRLADKAARKGRSQTVVFAELWERSDGQRMVVFCEGGPHPWADRSRPDERSHGHWGR